MAALRLSRFVDLSFGYIRAAELAVTLPNLHNQLTHHDILLRIGTLLYQ